MCIQKTHTKRIFVQHIIDTTTGLLKKMYVFFYRTLSISPDSETERVLRHYRKIKLALRERELRVRVNDTFGASWYNKFRDVNRLKIRQSRLD